MRVIERPFGPVEIPNTWDSSMLSDLRNCPRYFYWRHIRGAETDTPSLAPHFGVCIHECLRCHYLMHDIDGMDAVVYALSTCMPQTGDERRDSHKLIEALEICSKSGDPRHNSIMQVFDWNWEGGDGDGIRNSNVADDMMKRYVAHYKVEPFTILEPRDQHLEIGFVYQIAPGVWYYGRIDMIVDWPPWGIVPIDHKTSRAVGANKFKEFNPFLQGDGYLMAAKHYYENASTVAINVLQTAKTKKELVRFIEPRSPEQLDAWYHDVMDLIDEAMWRFHYWNWPRDRGGYGGACTHWGECQFKSLCVTPEFIKVENCDRQSIPGGYVESWWKPWDEEGVDRVITKRETRKPLEIWYPDGTIWKGGEKK